MHIQITKFNLKGMSVKEYERTRDQLANCFANVKGLIKKYGLKNISENIYGEIYVWEDKSYMEEFSKTELFNTILNHPNFENIVNSEFEVVESLKDITKGKNNKIYIYHKKDKNFFETNQEI